MYTKTRVRDLIAKRRVLIIFMPIDAKDTHEIFKLRLLEK
jgi:hypothetical protein